MMDVAWGLCTRSASAVASSAHQPQGRGGNTGGKEGMRGRGRGGEVGRDTNQTSHFPRSLINICVADL